MKEEYGREESLYGFKREDLTDEDVENIVREHYKNRDEKVLKKHVTRSIWGASLSAALMTGGMTTAYFQGRDYRPVVREVYTLERKTRELESLDLKEGIQEINARIDRLKNSDEYRAYREESNLVACLWGSGMLGLIATPVLLIAFGNKHLIESECERDEELWSQIPERMQMKKEAEDRLLIKWAEEFFSREFPEKPDDDKPYEQRSYVIKDNKDNMK